MIENLIDREEVNLFWNFKIPKQSTDYLVFFSDWLNVLWSVIDHTGAKIYMYQ